MKNIDILMFLKIKLYVKIIGIIIIELAIERIKTIWKTENSPTSVFIKIM
mgnify:CR=1 FL=1